MAKLWQDWIEFQESDEECRRFADAIGFHYSDEAFALLESDYDAFKDWMQELTENTAQQLIQPDTEYGAG